MPPVARTARPITRRERRLWLATPGAAQCPARVAHAPATGTARRSARRHGRAASGPRPGTGIPGEPRGGRSPPPEACARRGAGACGVHLRSIGSDPRSAARTRRPIP
ncbi:MAG: hypothetical protein ACK55I_10880, partial [bacterium]